MNQINSASTPNAMPVVLPCPPEHFREFISGLLGQPQEVDGGKFGAFCIDKNGIDQVYHLVTQRVFQQHGVHPVAFNIRIAFDDGTSIQLNSIEDFRSYSEPKPVISTECHITFVYLIQFATASSPEKQEISVSFVSSQESKSHKRHIATFASGALAFFGRGYISYRIKYTARTWGADVESLLINYIDTNLKKESNLRSFVRRRSVPISLFVAAFFFVSFYIGQSIVTGKVIDAQLKELAPLFGPQVPLAEKLDFLVHVWISGSLTQLSDISTRLTAIAAVIALVIIPYVENKADSKRPSFVLLTKQANDEKEIAIDRYKTDWRMFWISAIGSVILSVTSNFLYDKYAKGALEKMLESAQTVASKPLQLPTVKRQD